MKSLGSIFLFFFLIGLSLSAQNHKVDSLLTVLNAQELNAKKQIDLYKELCSSFLLTDADQLLVYGNKGLTLAKEEKDFVNASLFYRMIGKAHHIKGDYDSALTCFFQGLEYTYDTENELEEAKLYGSIASSYMFQNKDSTALDYNLKALRIFEKINDKRNIGITLCNMGNIHVGLLNEQEALKYFLEAKAIGEELNDNHIKSVAYYSLGNIYIHRGDYDKVRDYNLKTLELSRISGNKSAETVSLLSLAYYYCAQEKEYATAEKYATEGLQLAEELEIPRFLVSAKYTLSTIYLYQKRYSECEKLSMETWGSDSTAIESMNPEARVLLYNITLSSMYIGKIEQAKKFLNKFQEVIVGQTDDNYQNSLADMQVKYETEKKELQITSLEKEKTLYVWLGIAGVLFALTLILILWLTIKTAKKEKLLIATRSVMDGEMGERARVARDLHDRLSGNLSAVKIELNTAVSLLEVSKKLDRCIDEVRRVAHNLMPASLQYGVKVALEDFSAQLPTVHFHFFGLDKRFDERAEFVVYCCASELVGNSLKHSEADTINIQLVQDDRHITLTVQDNGTGYDVNAENEGLGLKNIYDRVASCNGKIDVVSSPDKGTETTIEIKIK